MKDQFELMLGLDQKDAFEGWFYKINDEKLGLMVSVILGYSTVEEDPHAFIQFTSSIAHQTHYLRYSLEKFSTRAKPFEIRLGKNIFSKNQLILDIDQDGLRVEAKLKAYDFQEIKTSPLRPNIMGILSYLPNQCNHSITSMHHWIDGSINIGNKKFYLEGALGYMEKDWGASFLSRYVWVQANDSNKNSLVFANASVPVLGSQATGFFAVLHFQGQEYRFSTVEASKIYAFQADKTSLMARIKKGNTSLVITAYPFNSLDLRAPKEGAMNSFIKESLNGYLRVELYKYGDKLGTFESSHASMDLHWLD